MFSKILKINIIFLFCTSLLFAEMVEDFKINGNDRISDETIKVFLKVKKGDDLNPNDINKALKNLYNTNFFKDVNLSLVNGQLLVNVVENPIIQSIEFLGIKTKKINEALSDVITLKEKSSFQESYLDNDVRAITNILKQWLLFC